MSDKKSPGSPTDKDKWQKFAEKQSDEKEEEASSAEPAAEVSGLNLEFPDHQKVEEQLAVMEQRVDEYKDKNLRLLAQLKNIQERAERDVSNAHKYGTEKLINELLPVVDSLARGLENGIVEDTAAEALREGMQLTLDILIKVLKKHGVEIISPKIGDPFNPGCHEAMSMQPAPGSLPNTIAEVLQQGYSLNGRVLRAAMVIVVGG